MDFLSSLNASDSDSNDQAKGKLNGTLGFVKFRLLRIIKDEEAERSLNKQWKIEN